MKNTGEMTVDLGLAQEDNPEQWQKVVAELASGKRYAEVQLNSYPAIQVKSKTKVSGNIKEMKPEQIAAETGVKSAAPAASPQKKRLYQLDQKDDAFIFTPVNEGVFSKWVEMAGYS